MSAISIRTDAILRLVAVSLFSVGWVLGGVSESWPEELDMSEGLDNRHRDSDGTIDRKHGNTRVATLRGIYGDGFAPGYRADMKLETLLARTGSQSLSQYRASQKARSR